MADAVDAVLAGDRDDNLFLTTHLSVETAVAPNECFPQMRLCGFPKVARCLALCAWGGVHLCVCLVGGGGGYFTRG